MESKTRIFQRTDVWVLSQKKKNKSVTCSGGSSQSIANFSIARCLIDIFFFLGWDTPKVFVERHDFRVVEVPCSFDLFDM